MRAGRRGGLSAAISVAGAALLAEAGAQAERWALWTPVAFGAGSAAYFALGREPRLAPCLLLAMVAGIAAWGARRWTRAGGLWMAAALLAFASAGFADGALSTRLAAAPVVPDGVGVVEVDGWVADVASPSAGRTRLLLAPIRIGGLSLAQTPARVRLTLRAPASPEGAPPQPGEAVRVRAILDPPPGPASPGAYDFARDAWFERVGGVGLALTPPEIIEAPPPPWTLRLSMAVNRFRWRLAARLTAGVRDLLGPDAPAGLAAAVSTSHQDWLSAGEVQDLRDSGLAHMLAIAGLHTAAVSGFVFLAIRLAVAAWPWLALRVSGKKLAALGGLVAVAAYLLLSGGHPPARRAAITAAIAFLAILTDRRAVSLRSLAVAALAILVLQPVAVVEPGFQMSFAATAALVAMAEVWPRSHRGAIQAPWFLVWPQRLKDTVVALGAVSLVAGAATAPFAIQYFNRLAAYGLFANFAADFLASAVLMPALVLAGLGEAVGAPHLLLAPALAVAGWSGAAILAIAHAFAIAPGAVRPIASAPGAALVLSFLGVIGASLWRGRLRWAMAPLAAAVLVWPRPPAPAVWIAADGDNAAIAVEGRALLLKPAVRTFAGQAWAARRGLVLPFDPQAEAELAFDCNRSRCLPRYGTEPALGAWWSRRAPRPGDLDALCRASEVLIIRAETAVPAGCGASLVLTAQDFARGGAAELYPALPGGWRVVWSQPMRGLRPWTGPSGRADPD